MPKRYRVTGSTSTLGHEPGSVFEADIPDEQERRMIARGSIELDVEDVEQVERQPQNERTGEARKPPARVSENAHEREK